MVGVSYFSVISSRSPTQRIFYVYVPNSTRTPSYADIYQWLLPSVPAEQAVVTQSASLAILKVESDDYPRI